MPTATVPTWVRSSTAAVRPRLLPAAAATPVSATYNADNDNVANQAIGFDPPVVPASLPPPPLPTVQSPDGRLVLTDSQLLVAGQEFSLRALERAEVHHVRWVLWILLGGLGVALVLIAFLQNWLHTLPAAAGLVLGAGLLAYGQRGTNRLRLWQLGPQPLHVALPGELATWQRLVAELNRRIIRDHDRAATEAAAVLVDPAPAQAESFRPPPAAES